MTEQVYEEIVIDGIHTTMDFYPPLPESDTVIVEVEGYNNSRSDCWRDYVGTWEIDEGRLYLKSLRGKYQLVGSQPVLAYWFSGTLVIPQGENLGYLHSMFTAVYEREIHVRVANGVVLDHRIVDNTGQHN